MGAATKEERARMEQLMAHNLVGPIVQAGEFAEATVEALEKDNPGKKLEVIRRASYIRIYGESPIRLTKASLEESLGREVRFPGEVEVNLSSFTGRIKPSSEEIVWYFETKV